MKKSFIIFILLAILSGCSENNSELNEPAQSHTDIDVNVEEIKENAYDMFGETIVRHINYSNYYYYGHETRAGITDSEKIVFGIIENYHEANQAISKKAVDDTVRGNYATPILSHLSIQSPYIEAVYENEVYTIMQQPRVGAVAYDMEIDSLEVIIVHGEVRIECDATLLFHHADGLMKVGNCKFVFIKDHDQYRLSDYSQTISDEPTYNENVLDDEIQPSSTDDGQDEYIPILSFSDMSFGNEGIYDLVENTVYYIDLDHDGIDEQLSFVDTTHDEEVVWQGKKMTVTAVGNITINVNGVVYDELYIQYGMYAYLLIKENGSVGLIVCGEMPDDNYVFDVYRFEDGKPVRMGGGGLKLSDLTMQSFKQSGTIYLFGNHTATIHCALNEDFTYTYLDDGYYELLPQPLTTKMEILVFILEDGEYIEKSIPSGEVIIPTRISPEGCMFFEMEDGREGKLYFTTGEGMSSYVNGKHEEDVFDGIYYAGG